jgi:hypothetical protein
VRFHAEQAAFDCPLDGFNLAIQNQHWDESLEQLLFHGEVVNHIPADSQTMDLFDLLVMFEVFASRGQAKKSWKRAGGPGWPSGFHDWFIGKKKIRITIWNPVEG